MKVKNPQFGDIDSLVVSVNGQDITESVAQVLIFQDIMTPFTSCQIDVIDTIGMLQQYGMKPDSDVTVKIGVTQGFDTDGETMLSFKVHDIGNKRQVNHKTYTYTLQCAPKEYIVNQNKRVCKAFDKKRADEIVKDVAQEFLGAQVADEVPNPEQLEPHTPFVKDDGQRIPSRADNDITYIAPNISPLNVIAAMCKTATYNGKADFVFFTKTMSKSGAKYAFESLSNMWKRKPHFKLVQRPNNIREDGDINRNKNLEFQNLAAHHFNAIVNIATGYDANTVYTFDVVKKTWEVKDKERDGVNKIGEKESNIRYLPKADGVFDEGENVLDKGQEWYSSRRNNLFSVEQNRIIVQLTGQTKAFNWLSEICEIDIPSANSMSSENLDEKYKGAYMVVSVAHIISRTSYFVNVELANGWDK